MPLRWNGELIKKRVQERALQAAKETVEAAAQHARQNHPWASETGEEEASVWTAGPEMRGTRAVAFWGAESPAVFLELGTQYMDAFPFLRPAADFANRGLADRLRGV